MKKTKAAPIAMYPTKNRKKVIVSSVLPSRNSGNPFAPTGSVSAALTDPAKARAKVATKSRLVVLENFSDIMFLKQNCFSFHI